jgi:CDGSH-type Zn-finger protein
MMPTMSEPVCAQLSPFAVTLEEGKKYAWCACGRSAAQPLCDGSHKGTGLSPLIFAAEKTETGFLCGCKQTRNPPFCDGSHSNVAAP